MPSAGTVISTRARVMMAHFQLSDPHTPPKRAFAILCICLSGFISIQAKVQGASHEVW